MSFRATMSECCHSLTEKAWCVRLICAFDIDDTTFIGFIDISGQVFWFIALEAMHFMHNMQIQK